MIMIQFFLFLTLVMSILFGSHALLYALVVHLFSINPGWGRYVLGGFLAVASISFFTTSALVRFHENLLTRGLYFLSGVWLGMLTNFILVSLLIFLLGRVFEWMGMSVTMVQLASIGFLFALALSIFGVWKATHPEVKNITVHIPRLPEEWKGRKIAHISDVHLGAIYQRSFMKDVVDKINASKVDMVVITGDLFDGMDGNLSDMTAPLGEIQSSQGVFYVTGNHETYLGVSTALSALEGTKVRVLWDEAVDVSGLQVIGISYPERQEKKDVVGIVKRLSTTFPNQPTLLLYHAPTHIEEFQASGVNLQLSGHTHRGQLFPFRYITRWMYRGFDYGLHVRGEYAIYTSSGTGTWGPPMRTGTTSEIVVMTLE